MTLLSYSSLKNADVSLRAAVLIGDLAKVKSLIEEGADINAKDASGNTPLYYAIQQRNEDIAELLIAKGADVNAKNKSGQTALDIAIDQDHTGIVELLRKHGAKE